MRHYLRVLAGMGAAFLADSLESIALAAPVPLAYVKAPEARVGAQFGSALAASGRYLVVGAPGEVTDDNPFRSGAAYLYLGESDLKGWTPVTRLQPPLGELALDFGAAVAVSRLEDDVMVVAVASPDSDLVYLFEGPANSLSLKEQWSVPGSRFGAALALSRSFDLYAERGNEILVIGAPDEDSVATDSGAVFVTERTAAGQWTGLTKIKASNPGEGDGFGASVAIAVSPTVLVVGAPWEDGGRSGVDANQDDESRTDAGAAYIFVPGTSGGGGREWRQTTYLKASHPDPEDYFGSAVAVSTGIETENLVAVGAPGEDSESDLINGPEEDNGASYSGAVYAFRGRAQDRNPGWYQQAYLKAPDSGYSHDFGASLAIKGNYLYVGAPDRFGDFAPSGAGRVYGFTVTGPVWYFHGDWETEEATDDFDSLGSVVVATTEGREVFIITGAPGDDSSESGAVADPTDNSTRNAGAVHVFDRFPAAPPRYASDPPPFETIIMDIGHAAAGYQTITLWNRSAQDLKIMAIDLVHGANGELEYVVSKCRYDHEATRPVLGCDRIQFPYTIPGNSAERLYINMTWINRPDPAWLAVLRVKTGDPVAPVVHYEMLSGTGRPLRNFEETLLSLVALIYGGSDSGAKPAGPNRLTLPGKARFEVTGGGGNVVQSEVPPHLGGGSVTLTDFTGYFEVEATAMTNAPDQAALLLLGGEFVAPSFRLPSGLETGTNTLTFGPSRQSGGVLDLTSGEYSLTATARIVNRLIPGGVPVSGSYTGKFDVATGKVTVRSRSADLFYPSAELQLLRSGGTNQLVWLGGDVLEKAFDLDGPWEPVTGASSPLELNPTERQRYFRLRTLIR